VATRVTATPLQLYLGLVGSALSTAAKQLRECTARRGHERR
jgi:hypothetical protein